MVYTMRRHQLGFRLVEHQWVRSNPECIVYCDTYEAQSAHSYSVCEDNLFQLVVDYAFNGGKKVASKRNVFDQGLQCICV